MRISVIIPAYNEARRIERTLVAVSEYLLKHFPEHEIIVVNNRSTDATRSLVLALCPAIQNLKLIDEPVQGKGAAVAAGMRQATGDVRLFMDADNSTPVSYLESMLPYLERGYDVVIGSIAVSGSKIVSREPWYRRVFGTAGNQFIQLLAVPGIYDTQRGFKVFTARAAQDIFPRLTVIGWGFDVEVLAIARQRGYRVWEVPVIWDNSRDTRVTWHAYPEVLWQTIKIAWNVWTGKYAKS